MFRTNAKRGCAFALLLMTFVTSMDAAAIPAFARQTKLQCGMCHAPPPELTAFGRRFMLSGFSFRTAKPNKVPLSVFAYSSHTNVDEDVPGSRTDDTDLQRVRLYAAGRIAEGTGAYVTADYDGGENQLALSNVDLRKTRNTYIGQRNVLLGALVNNNPGFQDPWSTATERAWPFLFSRLEPQPRNAPVLDGQLSRRVVGAGGYAFVDDSLYGELTVYSGVSDDFSAAANVDMFSRAELDGTAVYARAVREVPLKLASLSYGAMLFSGERRRDDGLPSDDFTDVGIDAQYQRERGAHNFSLSGGYLREFLDTSASRDAGLAQSGNNDIDRLRLSARYLYRKKYGVGVGHDRIDGSDDALYFSTQDGTPRSTYSRIELFWNPISKPPLKAFPYARMRLGIQYTRFHDFDGGGLAGALVPRSASDNDTLNLFWIVAY